MKNSIIIFTLFISSFNIYAQSYDGFGDQKINLGYQAYGNGTGINFTYDYGLGKFFSLGLGFVYFIDDEVNDYFIAGRTNLHLADLLDLPQQLDIYPGVELGYLSGNDIEIAGYVGIRYFFSKKFGVYGEFGSIGSLGFTVDL